VKVKEEFASLFGHDQKGIKVGAGMGRGAQENCDG
jgi:hypothetical protein